MDTLPLFPLHTVLFPGQLLPLHIFEERYRQMIGECLRLSRPFGVVLIQDGDEAGDQSVEPHEVGTTAHIVQAEQLDDGRLNIMCVGHTRFRITATYRDLPYLRGAIDWWPWEPLDEDHSPLVGTVRTRLDRYLKLLGTMVQSEITVEIPAEAPALANLVAAVLQIEAGEKQQLLTTHSIGELLDRELSVLQRELRELQIIHAARHKPAADESALSLN